MSERKERCDTCKWWDDCEYTCHRYPPSTDVYYGLHLLRDKLPLVSMNEQCFTWPMTRPDDFCGEWQAKDVPEMAIEELGLSVRAKRVVDGHGITNTRELCRLTEDEFLRHPKAVESVLREVKAALAIHGLTLAQQK